MFNKNLIMFIGIIIGLILGGAVVYAGTFLARDIDYDNTISNLNATNVQNAIDELYSKAHMDILNKITIKQQNALKGSSSRSNAVFYFENNIINNYTYFKIIDKSVNAYVDSCTFMGKDKTTNENVTLNENTIYNTNGYTHIWSDMFSTSSSGNNYARCYYYIELSN